MQDDSSIVGPSIEKEESHRKPNSNIHSRIPEDVVVLEDPFICDSLLTTKNQELPDFKTFLNILASELASLEARRKALADKAFTMDVRKTSEVLVSHGLMIKTRLEDTINQLEDIIFGASNESCAASESNLLVTAQSDVKSSIFCNLESLSTGMKTSEKDNIAVQPQRDGLVLEKLENIESLIREIMPNRQLPNWSRFGSPTPEERKATKWVKELRQKMENCKNYSDIDELGSQLNIQTTYSFMRTYYYNHDLEKDSLKVLQMVSEYSKEPCSRIYDLDCFDGFCDRFQNVWLKWEDISYDIIRIIYNITRQSTLVKYTLQDNLIELFLKPLESHDFREVDIVCVDALGNMIIAAEGDWNFKMTRRELEIKIEKGMIKWRLGTYSHLSLHDYTGHVKRIVERDGVLRHFSLWYITNQAMLRPLDCKYLTEQGSVEKLVQLLLKDSLDPEIDSLAKTCLKSLDKHKS